MCSVGQQRHRQTLVTAEEDGARDGGRAVAVAHAVERGVEGEATSWTAPACSRFPSATPTSVMPRRWIVGMAVVSSALTAVRIGSVSWVA